VRRPAFSNTNFEDTLSQHKKENIYLWPLFNPISTKQGYFLSTWWYITRQSLVLIHIKHEIQCSMKRISGIIQRWFHIYYVRG
jgi:hypothetical protein